MRSAPLPPGGQVNVNFASLSVIGSCLSCSSYKKGSLFLLLSVWYHRAFEGNLLPLSQSSLSSNDPWMNWLTSSSRNSPSKPPLPQERVSLQPGLEENPGRGWVSRLHTGNRRIHPCAGACLHSFWRRSLRSLCCGSPTCWLNEITTQRTGGTLKISRVNDVCLFFFHFREQKMIKRGFTVSIATCDFIQILMDCTLNTFYFEDKYGRNFLIPDFSALSDIAVRLK